MEKSKGTAEIQAELARSEVGITIKSNNATARKAEADGEAEFISKTGAAKAAEVRAVGLANAEAYQKQVDALGQGPTALVNAISALSNSSVPFMPNNLVTGGRGQGGFSFFLFLASCLSNQFALSGKRYAVDRC